MFPLEHYLKNMPKQTTDGIQVMQFYEVQGAIVSASVSLTTGTAAILIAGDSDYFLDLVKITGSTTSSIAAGTAGFNIALLQDGSTMANYPFGNQPLIDIDYFPTLRQNTKNLPWVVDMDDVTGGTVNFTAFFIKRSHT